MNTLIRYIILLALVITACSVEPKVMNIENTTQIINFGDQYFLTLTDKPLSETIKPIENVHVKGQMDEWHTAKYEGALVAYYRVVPDKRNLLSRLELTSNKVNLPFGLHVGVSQATVVRALGKPTSNKDGLLEYTFEDPYAQTVSFKINNGVVQMITWIFEID